MPLYEDKHNAENYVKVGDSALSQTWIGNQKVIGKLAELIAEGKSKIAFDGWYGVDFEGVVDGLKNMLEGDSTLFIPAYTLFKSVEQLKEYKQPNITDDPGFGYVNSDGKIEDLMDDNKVEELCNKIKASKETIIVYD